MLRSGSLASTVTLSSARQSWAKSLTRVPQRASHIGRAPVKIGSDVTLQHLPPTSSAGAFGPIATLRVTGPLGSMPVPIHPFVEMDLLPEQATTPSAVVTVHRIVDPSAPKAAAAAAAAASADATVSNVTIQVRIKNPKKKEQRAMWGTTRALLANAVRDVTEGFSIPLTLVGVGYRAALENDGRLLTMKLGHAHPINIPVPEGVTVVVPYTTRIVLSGVDRQQITQFAAQIRRWREPEPYNQKGIFVAGETIRKKEGKKK